MSNYNEIETIAIHTFMLIALLSDRWSGLTFGILHRMFSGVMSVQALTLTDRDLQSGEILLSKTIILVTPFV